jgi:hypothetical protein
MDVRVCGDVVRLPKLLLKQTNVSLTLLSQSKVKLPILMTKL